MNKIENSVLSDVINKRQSDHVVNALAETNRYYNEYVLKKTLADILDEACYGSNTDFPIEMLPDALEELRMNYILCSPRVLELVPISLYLAKNSYGMTCCEYYLLGVEVHQSEYCSNIKYYIFVVENNHYRRIEITNKFSTLHLTKDYSYKPKCIGNIIDGLAYGNRGNDIG